MSSHRFVTVDAETAVIDEGVRAIAEIRDRVESRKGIRIPLVWFVRFQRGWTESVEGDSAEAFEQAPSDGYDGFALAHDALVALLDRGDEVGWHYHAYNYVHRDDLSHAMKLAILRADLASCAAELRRRHPEFPVASFRFGWMFVPDYDIYPHLRSLGLTRDASIDPKLAGRCVTESSSRFLEPLVTEPARIDGMALFPRERTVLTHDWQVVAHDFGWSRLGEREALARRRDLESELTAAAAELKANGGEFLTYEAARV